MKPPFAYYGGKTGLAARIVSLLPPHRVYLEPYFGSGAVLFAKRPATHEIVNDLDGAVVAFFRMLRDRPGDLERVCALTPYARAEYEVAELDAGVDGLELARRFWIRVNQGVAKTGGTRTGWSVATARSQSAPASVVSRLARFERCAERLARVSIECRDGAGLVERLATPETVVYADPPYLGTVRVRESSSGDYREEMTDPAEHRRLAEVLKASPATVVLSGYPSALYEELYGDWWHLDVPVTAHSSGCRRRGASARVERLWANRELDLGQLRLTGEGG